MSLDLKNKCPGVNNVMENNNRQAGLKGCVVS